MNQVKLEDIHQVADQVKTQADQTLRKARRWLWDAREAATTKAFDLNVKALERADTLASRAGSVAGERAERTVHSVVDVLQKITIEPPVPGYAEMNVREAMNALRDVDRYGLLRIRRFEAAHKNRKTVLDAIQREVDRRARLAEFGV